MATRRSLLATRKTRYSGTRYQVRGAKKTDVEKRFSVTALRSARENKIEVKVEVENFGHSFGSLILNFFQPFSYLLSPFSYLLSPISDYSNLINGFANISTRAMIRAYIPVVWATAWPRNIVLTMLG